MKKILITFTLLLTVVILTACSTNKSVQTSDSANAVTGLVPETVDYGSLSDLKPTQSLEDSVMSAAVIAKLGGSVSYSADDYFVVGKGQAKISATTGTPYAKNTPLNSAHQGGVADALLQKSSYQPENRNQTGNGEGNFRPYGYQQMKLAGSKYQYLFNLGHLLGYALVGNIRGFDASESNPNNILTQTAWANQANGGAQGKGQNYWEGVVRDEIKNTSAYVRYEVTPIYANDTDIVPVGNEIQAISNGSNINFNVFVPNVEPGVKIDYATGKGTITEGKSKSMLAPAAITSSTPAESADTQSNRTVYVADNGKASAYWYDKSHMPAGTNQSKVISMTESQAIARGKHHSGEEK